MIKKIVSGGRTGAEQAALDAAIKLGIPYSGWIPKGGAGMDRNAQKKYQLHEMTETRFAEATAKNTLYSNASLIISYGAPTGNSAITRKCAMKNRRRWLHIDLNATPEAQAISIVSSWIRLYDVDVLNITGPRSSKNPNTYHDTMSLLVKALCVSLVKDNIDTFFVGYAAAYRTVNTALQHIVSGLSFKQKVMIANMNAAEIESLQYALDLYIGNHTEMTPGSRLDKTGLFNDADHGVIMKNLWQELRETHGLRIIK